MSSVNIKGIDSAGYVQSDISIEKVSAAFKPVLSESISGLVRVLGSKLHSIYLYGSVGRGNAVFGESNLDLSIIVKTTLSEAEEATLNQLERNICCRYEAISKLECDVGSYAQAMVANEYEWQFWLKHMCICVWGDDLREGISPYKPSLKVGLEMNKDIRRRLLTTLKRLNDNNYLAEGKSIAKKVLRTHYALYSEMDNSFYTSLPEIAACLQRYEPEMKNSIEDALSMAKGLIASQQSVVELINGYGRFVVSRFEQFGGSNV